MPIPHRYFPTLAITLACLLLPGLSICHAAENVRVQYLNATDAKLTGKLQSNTATGEEVFNDPDLTSAALDDADLPTGLRIRQQGERSAICEADLYQLCPDESHTSNLTTYDHDGEVLDQSTVLLSVDTTPPEIQLLAPTKQPLGYILETFTVLVTDDESGVSSNEDENEVLAKLNNRKSNPIIVQPTEEGLKLLVGFSSDNWSSLNSADFYISIKDRAGNLGEFSKTFTVTPFETTMIEYDLPNRCDDKRNPSVWKTWDCDIDISLTELLYPRTNTYQIDIILGDQLIDAEGYPGYVMYQMANRIRFVGDLPSYLEYDREILWDTPDLHKATVRFTVRQKALAPISENVYPFKIEYPKDNQFDLDQYDICSIYDFYQSEISVNPWDHYADTAPILIHEMAEATFPISLNWETPGVKCEANQEDEKVFFEATPPSMPYPIDAQASWFSLDSAASILEKTVTGFEATVPALVEGVRTWHAGLVCKVCTWNINSSREKVLTGEIFIKLDPPQIFDFRYDPDQEQLLARIEDDGTPLGDLVVQVQILGEGAILFDLDPESGELSAAYPLPFGVKQAFLSVRDAASQSASATCTIFGETDSDIDDDWSEVLDSGGSENENPPLWDEFDQSDNLDDDFQETVENIDIHRDSYNVVASQSRRDRYDGYEATYYNKFEDGLILVRLCPIPGRACPAGYDPEAEYRQCVTCWKNCNNLSASGGSDYVEFCQENCSGNSQAMGKSLGEVCDLATFKLFCGTSNVGYETNQLPVGAVYSEGCHTEWRDILSPRIENLRMPNTQTVRALIHDHGQPLDELTLTIKVQYEKDFTWIDHTDAIDYDFNTLTGEFRADLNLPGEAGEQVSFEITVRDQANNRSSADLLARLSRKPPELNLSVVRLGDQIYLSQTRINAYLRVDARDGSFIDGDRSRLWIDETPVTPFTIMAGSLYSTELHQPPYICSPWTAFFGGLLSEGPHTARARVYDTNGLWTEKSIIFEIKYTPRISHFKAFATQIQESGATAFSAMIEDAGKDLSSEGIDFELDSQLISAERCHYDVQSGYFSVDGPFELTDQEHYALLRARDKHGHQAQATLSFRPGYAYAPPATAGGRVDIEQVAIMELEDHNGDGRANPGEHIRVFVTLHNTDTVFALEKVSGRLASQETGITVEQSRVYYGSLPPDEAPAPLTGYDITIDPDFLEDTFADPYAAEFVLTVQSDRGEATELGFTIPIERPTLPLTYTPPTAGDDQKEQKEETFQTVLNSVRVRLDRTPTTIRKTVFILRGKAKSTHYQIAEVWAMVGSERIPMQYDEANSRFEGEIELSAGENLIYVEAYDESGAMGMASARITCVPPADNAGESSSESGSPATTSVVTIHLNMDRLPSVTSSDNVQVWGQALSSESVISMVEMSINGSLPVEVARWNSTNGRFRDRAYLELGQNTIEVTAYDESGAWATVTHTVLRTASSLDLAITDPIDGAHYGNDYPYTWPPEDCPNAPYNSLPDPFVGTFDSGGQEIVSFRYEMVGDGGETVTGDVENYFGTSGPFSFFPERPATWGDGHLSTIILSVTMETSDGQTITRSITFTYYFWPYCS